MKTYIVGVRHEKKTLRFEVNATNGQEAQNIVMKAEKCPASAIKYVYDKNGEVIHV